MDAYAWVTLIVFGFAAGFAVSAVIFTASHGRHVKARHAERMAQIDRDGAARLAEAKRALAA